MTLSLQDLQAFARVARLNSFSMAAESLDVSVSALSKAIARLEARLGCPLFNRSTRRISLTPAGERLHGDVKQLLELAEDIESRHRSRSEQVAGLLKVNASTPLGRLVLIPALPRLLERFPDLRIDLRLSDSGEDLIEGGRDVAIWFGDLPDQRLRYRTIARTHRITCAAPSYLRAFGAPAEISELRQHRCLATSGWWQQLNWRFRDQQAFDDLRLEAFMQLSSSDALRASTLHGLGIAQASSLMFNESLITRGALVQLFPDQVVPGEDVHVVYPNARVENRLVRVFVDFVVEIMQESTPVQQAGAAASRGPAQAAVPGGAAPVD